MPDPHSVDRRSILRRLVVLRGESPLASVLRAVLLPTLLAAGLHGAWAQPAMQRIDRFEIDRTEVPIAQFKRFVDASALVTAAERAGGGSTYENGWQQRAGWTWRAPFGKPGTESEPVVHVTYDEAAAFCRWAGKRLPTEDEWDAAAYVERRDMPPPGFVAGRAHPFPTGSSPLAANCLDCAPAPVAPGAVTSRGRGHSEVGRTPAGVNGLYDMGGNVWEWAAGGDDSARPTRGGSWWYGAEQMRRDHRQTKPASTAVVYIGFRCARTVP